MNGYDYYDYPKYETVDQKKKKAAKQLVALAKRLGRQPRPALVNGKKIANTFWGQAWNKNLEHYQHYENRLPRGRSYVKNGLVLDLLVEKGEITAIVSGTSIYTVTIRIKPLEKSRWAKLRQACAGQITSLIELLQGKLSTSVMALVTEEGTGLFPDFKDIRFDCTCPDYSDLCKHSAAAAYGVGARLDEEPQLLFLLRGVDDKEMITSASESVAQQAQAADDTSSEIDGDLSDIFGIDLGDIEIPVLDTKPTKKKTTAKKAVKKTVKKTAPKSPTKATKKTTSKAATKKATVTKKMPKRWTH